jgi:hypothetical protein
MTTQYAPIKTGTQTDIKIINKKIYAHTLVRSIADRTLVNVVAVDKKGELITVVEVDLSFEEGAEMVEALNRDLKEGKL